jgi:cbb3-type cytochrome oxidase subunit 3
LAVLVTGWLLMRWRERRRERAEAAAFAEADAYVVPEREPAGET